MRIAVMGTGGVGGYFGAKLALAGNDVTFVARGKHLDAIRREGLKVEGASTPMHVTNAQATEDVASIGPVDAVMYCVKLWDVETVAPLMKPLVADGGIVIPFQNGIDAPEMLIRVLGRDHVAGGIAYVAASIVAPGIIKVVGTMARNRVGAFDGSDVSRVHAFAEAGRHAGFEVEVVPDVRRALWEKFVMFCALSGATAIARQPIGVVRDDADLRGMFSAVLREALAVGRAKGITLSDDYFDRQMAFADGLPHEMRASMANDLAAGRRLEAPWLCGAVVRLGRELGVPTPVNETIFAALKPYVNGTPA